MISFYTGDQISNLAPRTRLLNATLLPEPYFAIYFIRASDITDEVEGSIGGAQLCVGCYDPSTFTGEM